LVQGELIGILRNRSGFRTLTITISELDVNGMIVLEDDKSFRKRNFSTIVAIKEFLRPLYRKEVEGLKASPRGRIAPCLNTSFSKTSFSDNIDAPPQLNGTVGGATIIFLQGTRCNLDERPPFKWEWFSEPLGCPPYVIPN
jgi:hypothetical protein